MDDIAAAAGVSRDAVVEYFRLQALREALSREVTTDRISGTTTEADVRHILVDTEAEANDVIAALNAGESFAALAAAVSTDGNGATGGEYTWAPTSNYVQAFRDAVNEAELGAIVGPVQTEFGYHVIQVRARRDAEMSEAQRDDARAEAFAEWLQEQRAAEGVTVETFPIWTSVVPSEPVFIAGA
jgi:parvulin-like peptidyl-prolyl isomerase